VVDDVLVERDHARRVVGLGVAHQVDETSPAATDADDLEPLADGAHGDGADRRVQTGDVPSAGKDPDAPLLALGHVAP